MRKVFNEAEAYLKEYELVSGEVSVLGIQRLFEATTCFANNDCQAFMDKSNDAKIDILLEIVAYFCSELGEVFRAGEILEGLQGKDVDAMDEYLRAEIIKLKKRWLGG